MFIRIIKNTPVMIAGVFFYKEAEFDMSMSKALFLPGILPI